MVKRKSTRLVRLLIQLYVSFLMKEEENRNLLEEVRSRDRAIEDLKKELALSKEKCERSDWDALTGLLRRDVIWPRCEQILGFAQRQGTSLCLLVVDIDNFKKVNDMYGHLVGDEMLKKFGEILNNSMSRRSDAYGRYGGEEFIILLPGKKKDGRKLAEWLRTITEMELKVRFGETNIKATISIGVAEFDPRVDSSLSLADLFNIADGALLQAKCDGRNRVCS